MFMAQGTDSFGLVLQVDVARTKKQIKDQISEIVKELNETKQDSFKLKIGVHKDKSRTQIRNDIKTIIEQFANKSEFKVALNVNKNITSQNFVKEINDVIDKINASGVHKVKIQADKIQVPNLTQNVSNGNNATSGNSSGYSNDLEHRIELIRRYRDEVYKVNQQISDLGIQTQSVFGASSKTFASTISGLMSELKDNNQKNISAKDLANKGQEWYQQRIDQLKTLKSNISRFSHTEGILDVDLKKTTKGQWEAFLATVKSTDGAIVDLKKNMSDLINKLDSTTNLKSFESIDEQLRYRKKEIENLQKMATARGAIPVKDSTLSLAGIALDNFIKTAQNSKVVDSSFIDKLTNPSTGLQAKFQTVTDVASFEKWNNEFQQLKAQFKGLEIEGKNVINTFEYLNALLDLKKFIFQVQSAKSGANNWSKAVRNMVEAMKAVKTQSDLSQWKEKFQLGQKEFKRTESSYVDPNTKQRELNSLNAWIDTTGKVKFDSDDLNERLQVLIARATTLRNSLQATSEVNTFNRLKVDIAAVKSELSGLKTDNEVFTQQMKALDKKDNAYNKYSKLYETIKQASFVDNTFKQDFSRTLSNLNVATNVNEINVLIDSLKSLAERYKETESIVNQRNKIYDTYSKFYNNISNSSVFDGQQKTEIREILNSLSQEMDSSRIQGYISRLQEFKSFYDSWQQGTKQVKTTNEWDKVDSNLRTSIQDLERLGLASSDAYVKYNDLLKALQSVDKKDFDGLKQIQQEISAVDALARKAKSEQKFDDYSTKLAQLQNELSSFQARIPELHNSTKDWQQIWEGLNTAFNNINSSNINQFATSLRNNIKSFDLELKAQEESIKAHEKQIEDLFNAAKNKTLPNYKAEYEKFANSFGNLKAVTDNNKEFMPQGYIAAYERAKGSSEQFRTLWETLSAALKNFDKEFQAKQTFSELTEEERKNLNVLNDLITKYQELKKVATGDITEANSLLKQTQTAQKAVADLRQLQTTMETFAKGNTRLFKNLSFGNSFKSLSAEIQTSLLNFANGTAIPTGEVENFTQRWRALKNEIYNTGYAGQTFGTKLSAQFSKLGVYFSAATVFMRIRTYMRNMYENIKEVDTAMTALKRITKETHDTYRIFFDDSIDRAKRLGATLSDTINATADFKRLGYNLEEATKLANTAITYQQVGDEVEDIGTATSNIVSTMKAFGIQANDSMMIVDKFNEVANNFSITAGGIGQALQNSASSLSAANNTLEESLGLIIAGNDVVQNPNEVGTALKTLTMRLRNAKADLSDLGEDTDGMADSVSKLRGQIKALSGVDIMATEDSFKSTYQILRELSKVWNSLTDVNQASLTELIAGKRQGNLMSSIMSNFADAENVVRVANRSMGSAETEHEKKLQSINGRLNVLQATFQELSATVMEDDLIKGVISKLTRLLEIINTLVEKGGSLKTIIAAIGTALLSFNNKGLFTKDALGDRHFAFSNYAKRINNEVASIRTSLNSIFDTTDSEGKTVTGTLTKYLNSQTFKDAEAKDTAQKNFITNSLKDYNKQLVAGIENTNNLADAQAKLKANTNFVNATLKPALQSIGNSLKNIGLSITNAVINMGIMMAAVTLINLLISAIQSTKKAIDEASQATQDFISKSKDLANTQDSIVALKEKLADKNITEEESLSVRKQLYELQKNMMDRYGAEAKGIDLVRDSVDGLNSSFETLRKKELEKEYRQNAEGYEESIARLYGEDSIPRIAWSSAKTGSLQLKTQWGHAVTQEEINALKESMSSAGLTPEISDPLTLEEAFSLRDTFYLELGTQLKAEGKTLFDLANAIDSITENLSQTIIEWRQAGKDTSQLESFLQQISTYYQDIADSDYSQDVANGKFMGEYLVETTKEYATVYKQFLQAQEKYQQEQISNPDKISKSVLENYKDARQQIQDLIQNTLTKNYGNDRVIKDFLQPLIDTANNDLAQEDFKLKIQANEDNLRTNLERIIKTFSNGKKIYADDIINFNPDSKANQKNRSIVNAFMQIKAQADKTGVSLETFVDWLVELGLVETDVAKNKSYSFVKMLDMTSESMEAVTKKIDEVQNAFKTVKEVIEDYEDKKILTIDSAQKLIDLGDNYIQYLFDENGHLEINEEAYSKLTKAKIDLLRTELLQNAIDNIKQIKTEADAVEYLKDKITEETKATQDYNTALLEKLYLEGMSNKSDKVQQAVKYIYDTYVSYSRILDNVNTSYQDNEMSATSETKALNDQKDALEKQKKALDKSKTALDDNKDALDKNKQALEDINTELEKDKDYIEDLIALTVEMLKQKYEDEKETIEKSKQAYKERVDSLKESLEKEKDTYDRYQSYFEKNKDISSLEKQATSLQGTTSVEGIQRLNEINKELSEKKQALYDEQYSNSINDRKDALDKEYERKEKLWDKEINRIDELLKNERQLRIQAMNLIDSKTQQFYNNLWDYTYKHTTKSRFEFENLWNSAYKALEKYGWGQLTCMQVMDLLEQKIYNNQMAIDGLDRQIKILNTSLDGTAKSIDGISREIDKLDEKINELSKSYEKAMKTKEKFENSKTENSKSNQAYNTYAVKFGLDTYSVKTTSESLAISLIQAMLVKDGRPVSDDYAKRNIKKYASGTSSSHGGLAIVDEDGMNSEWILKKGRLDYLPEGSIVFNKEETQALKFLAKSKDMVKQIISNPDYLSYFTSQMSQANPISHVVNGMKNWYQNISANQQKTINMPITVNAYSTNNLNERQFAKEIKNEVFREINKYCVWHG